ncbi:phosphotransferase family protein [Nocardiopsis sp. CNT312]|uniref:phosphotransferase family protein n=1 Tax=Nocardiopsis sp. CNT312 TaxID=1137268 RepID=UPI000490279B|nr:phosphotransferase [Nocardiopsis sp. CNT312]
MNTARPRWGDLPAAVRRKVTRFLGEEVVSEEPQDGGYTPAMASLLTTSSGRALFCKAMPEKHPLCATLAAEAAVAASAPAGAALPGLVWEGTEDGWRVVVFTAVRGRHANLSPGSDDVAAVVSALDGLAGDLTPCPFSTAPTAREALSPLLSGWSSLQEQPPPELDPWALANLERLAALEETWADHAGGDTLTHGDIRADQLLIDVQERVWVVDWAYPCRGAAWIDAVDLVTPLIMNGHTPEAAEKQVAGSARFATAPAAAVTSFAVAAAGYWARVCRQAPPPGPGGVRLRAFQARAADAALAWVRHRLGE